MIIQKALKIFTKKFFDPDEIPLSIILAFFGDQIVKEIDFYDDNKKKSLFSYIEMLINDKDEYLSTAIATGLCEAIAKYSSGEAKKKKILEEKILPYLGQNTKKHIKGWKEFN